MITTQPDWTAEAMCAQSDPTEFFPGKGQRATAAKRVCLECPVRKECLSYALANGEEFGVWGGLTENERRRLRAGKQLAEASDPRDYTEADRLLKSGQHTDTEISKLCGIPSSSVHRRREKLNLSSVGQRRTPAQVYAELAKPTDDGHRTWVGNTHTAVQGRHYRAARLAFLVGYGREPEGHVRTTCGRGDCVAPAHLADRILRAAQAARAAA